MPSKTTIDMILALRVLVDRRLEFQHGLLAAYIDLKKTLETVMRAALWNILRILGIPDDCPLLWDREDCEMWGRSFLLLPC